MYSQGISQFYLHTHTFIRNRNEPYLPLPSQPQLVLIYRPWRDGRLSKPWCKVAQAEIRTRNLAIANPALYHTATSAPARDRTSVQCSNCCPLITRRTAAWHDVHLYIMRLASLQGPWRTCQLRHYAHLSSTSAASHLSAQSLAEGGHWSFHSVAATVNQSILLRRETTN